MIIPTQKLPTIITTLTTGRLTVGLFERLFHLKLVFRPNGELHRLILETFRYQRYP